MKKLTELQEKMIMKIAESEFNGVDGAEPESHIEAFTWLDCPIECHQDNGVFVSLQNIEMVYNEGTGREGTARLTEKGFRYYKAELKAEQDAKNVEEDSSVQYEKSTCHRCGEDMGPDDDECHSCELKFAKKYDY